MEFMFNHYCIYRWDHAVSQVTVLVASISAVTKPVNFSERDVVACNWVIRPSRVSIRESASVGAA